MNKNHKYFIYILFALIMISLFFMLSYSNKKNYNYSLNGTYTIMSKNVILSLDIQTNEYHYYDFNHQISDLTEADGTFIRLDEDTIVFRTGQMEKTIVLIHSDGIKLIHNLDNFERAGIINFKKIDDTETILNK